MSILVICVIVLLILGIIILKGYRPGAKVNREEYLTKFQGYVNGKKRVIEDRENSYSIDFNFEGFQFSLEDIEDVGLNSTAYKVMLKHKMDNSLSLGFMEKQINATVRSNILIVSDLPKNVEQDRIRLIVPDQFKDMQIYSNNTEMANKLLDDKKIESIFLQYKNRDSRGKPLVSLSITDGVITLQFHNSSILNPSLHAIQSELANLEYYLDDIMTIAKKLKG